MRLVMIGCGGMGTYQAKKFEALGVTLVGAIDHNEEHRFQFCSTYGITESYASLEQLPLFQGRADAISCCLPDAFHHQCCLLALQLGFAVFCEKPLCTSLEEAKELALAGTERPFMVNFSKRSTPSLSALRQLLIEGTLGSLVSIEAGYLQSWQKSHVWGNPQQDFRWKWRLLPTYNPGGCLSDLGSHLLDALFLLFGSVRFEKTLHSVHDQVLIEYQGKLVAGTSTPCILTCSYCDDTWDDSLQLRVIGSLGVAQMNTTVDRKQVLVTPIEGESYQVSASADASPYQTFVQWVTSGVRGKPDIEDGLQVQRLLGEMIG